MDSTVVGGLIEAGLLVGLVVSVWLLVRREIRRMQRETDVGFQYTLDMVKPHRRVVAAARRQPKGVWLYTLDGYRLRVTTKRALAVRLFEIERLSPESFMLVPDEPTILESFVLATKKPPVWRRTRPAYGGEEGSIHVVDEGSIDTAFGEQLLAAMIVEVPDIVALAEQLEGACSRA
jgi:hypothetical protein